MNTHDDLLNNDEMCSFYEDESDDASLLAVGRIRTRINAANAADERSCKAT